MKILLSALLFSVLSMDCFSAEIKKVGQKGPSGGYAVLCSDGNMSWTVQAGAYTNQAHGDRLCREGAPSGNLTANPSGVQIKTLQVKQKLF